jgi:hypothetical protein
MQAAELQKRRKQSTPGYLATHRDELPRRPSQAARQNPLHPFLQGIPVEVRDQILCQPVIGSTPYVRSKQTPSPRAGLGKDPDRLLRLHPEQIRLY